MKKTPAKQMIAAAMASAIAVSALAGCAAGESASGGSSSGSKGLDASFGYAESKVKDFSSNKARLSAVFADKAFSTANATAMMLTGTSTAEDMEKIARYLFLDSVSVTDETGKITACYPTGNEGKMIKDIEELKTFNRVVKGIVPKLMSDPVLDEASGEYAVSAGVSRMDAAGAVVVGFKTADYVEVTGEKLADSCGVNTVILENGTILSTTLDASETGKDLASLGLKDEDIQKGSFEMTVGDAKYQCKSEVIETYTLISAEPQ